MAAMAGQGGERPRMSRVLLRMSDNYALVLLMLLFGLVVFAVVGNESWGREASLVVFGGTLLLALRASHVRRHRLARAALVLAAAAGLSVFGLAVGGATGTADLFARALLGVCLVATPSAIVVEIVRLPRVNLKTVLGALCIYLFIGLIFAYVYSLLAFLTGQDVFAQAGPKSSFDYVYFSYITIATVGYGDFTPAAPVAKACAVIEALLGQLYLVTVVALLVGNIGRTPVRRQDADGA